MKLKSTLAPAAVLILQRLRKIDWPDQAINRQQLLARLLIHPQLTANPRLDLTLSMTLWLVASLGLELPVEEEIHTTPEITVAQVPKPKCQGINLTKAMILKKDLPQATIQVGMLLL